VRRAVSKTQDFLDWLNEPQHARLLRLAYPNEDAPKARLVVNRFQGKEFISRGFEYIVELLSDDASIELEELHGKLMCVFLVQASGSLRPFTGYVSQFKFLKTDGGIAFYEAILVPWFEFLRLRQNNRLFHDQTLSQQAQAIFAAYGSLPAWEWKVVGEEPVFTMATQWAESDHNYLSRRMEAAGHTYWYDHADKGHTWVVCDDTRSAKPISGDAPTIRYHSEGGPDDEDAIAQWSPVRTSASAKLAISGFDFKDPRPVHVDVPGFNINDQDNLPKLEVHSYEGHYGFKYRSGANELAQRRMEEIDARGKQYEAQGNCDRVAAGHWFKFTGHFGHTGDDADFLILEAHHEATNNYLQNAGELAEYKNRFICQSKSIPWRPGKEFNSTDTKLLSLQTATVVGPQAHGSLHVDEYGRIRVRFHWDRDETSSCWVRVASNWAGGENGLISLPRVGSEAVIQCLDGNPDHPIVTSCVHNQHYMPPWKLPDQQGLTGLRGRELNGSNGNSAGGRSNHVVLEDTAGKMQVQLKCDHLTSQLSLGHIGRIEDNAGRKESRGQGFEVSTEGRGAVRAGQGMLISTEGRPNAQAHITDMGETVERLTQGQDLHNSMSDAAQQAKAHETGDQDEVVKALKAQNTEIKGHGGNPAQGEFPEFQAPHLTLASPAGIQTTTQGSTHVMSTEHNALTSGGHTSMSSGKSLLVSVREAIRLFAYKAGMKLIAASGDIDITALKDSINLLAKLNITQTANRITISAKEELVVNGGGSYSKWNGSGIEHGTSGVWRQQAAQHTLSGGASMGKPNLPNTTQLPKGQLDLYHDYVNQGGSKVEAVKQGEYTVIDSEGAEHKGTLDGKGFATVAGLSMGTAKVIYGKDPRDPWDEASHFGKNDDWPPQSAADDGADAAAISALGDAGKKAAMAGPAGTSSGTSGSLAGVAGAAGGAGSLTGALGKVGSMANMAKQAVGAVQAVQKGGAQGLLAQAGQTALGKAASSVPGGALAVSALSGGLSAKGGAQALLGQASGSLESIGMPATNTLSAGLLTGKQAIQALKLPGALPQPSMPALPTSLSNPALSKPDLLASSPTSPSIKPSFSINNLVT